MSGSRRKPGPLGPFVDGYRAWLVERGYTTPAVIRSLGTLGHLGRWMQRDALAVRQLSDERVSAFLAEYRRDHSHLPSASVWPLLEYLRAQGAVAPALSPTATAVEQLGLRAVEVARLRLDDLDWRAGQITVGGKAHRRDQLPLPSDVGVAIVAHLHHRGRRPGERHVFLTVHAPIRPLDPVCWTIHRTGRGLFPAAEPQPLTPCVSGAGDDGQSGQRRASPCRQRALPQRCACAPGSVTASAIAAVASLVRRDQNGAEPPTCWARTW